jgi:Ca-activated chloride channel family protein
MSGLDWARPGLLPELVAVWGAALLAVLAGRALARRRAGGLLGPAAARLGGGAGDALLLAALAALALALLGPRFGERLERVPGTGVDVVLLFDVSHSMRAQDVPPSRLERARALAGAVLGGLAPGDRAALAAFAGRGVLLTPLTPDDDALRALIPALDETLLSEGGSRLDDGVRAALTAFRPESARPRAILLLSDGEDPEARGELGLDEAAGSGARVVAVSFGAETGATIPLRDGALADRAGRPVVTRADPGRLRALAEPTGGAFFASDRFGDVEAGAVLAALRRDAARSGEGFVLRRVPRSGVSALAALALLALLAEVWLARRPLRGAPFAPAPARRRAAAGAALAALALLSLGVSDAERGADPLALEAEVRRAPDDAGALLRLGVARAAAGDLAEAERAFFAAAVRARDRETAADAYYDLGVVALERGDFEAARDAFFDGLALAPGDRRAQFNLEWTLRALASPPPGGGEKPPENAGRRGEAESEPEPERSPPPDEPEGADPGAQAQTPAGAGEPAEPAREGDEQPEENPVRLDPEAARRWLEAVADDPGRALRAAAREGGARGGRRGGAPLW